MKQMLRELEGEADKSTMTVWDFKLSLNYWQNMQTENQEVGRTLNNAIPTWPLRFIEHFT
jgi:hypothetical protein